MGFESESENLSDFIMEELAAALDGHGIEVADRRNLDLVMRELDFQMSGLVSDETFQGIGHFQGAEMVITGQLRDLGQVKRLAVTAIPVRTAIRSSAPSVNVRNDRTMREMVAALDRQPAAAGRGAEMQAPPRTAGTYLDRGQMFLDRGDFDLAIADSEAAVRIDPNNALKEILNDEGNAKVFGTNPNDPYTDVTQTVAAAKKLMAERAKARAALEALY